MAVPSIKPLNPEQAKYFKEKADADKFLRKKSVTIKYLKIIAHPLLEQECRKDPIISDMEIMKHPRGTNFRLTREQWNRILERANQNTA
jgi:predicted RNA-binding protein with PUA-like domain